MQVRRSNIGSNKEDEYVLLELDLPKNAPIDVNLAEQFIELLGQHISQAGQANEHLSLEIVGREDGIIFYIWGSTNLQPLIKKAFHEVYEHGELIIKEDYASRRPAKGSVYGAELKPLKKSAEADQAAQLEVMESIVAYLEKLDAEEQLWLQILIKPGQKPAGQGSSKLNYAANLFSKLSGSSASRSSVETAPTINNWQAKIRLIYQGRDSRTARLRLNLLETIFSHFHTARFAGLSFEDLSTSKDRQIEYLARFFIDKGINLSSAEISGLFNPAYLPSADAEEDISPNVVEAPNNIPTSGSDDDKNLSLIGLTTISGRQSVFGLKRSDRPRHIAVFGQAGMGKTSLLELLILSDIYWNQGFAVFDPNGSLAEDIIGFIPKRRHQDVLYLNLNDDEWPVAFNPLAEIDHKLKGRQEVEVVGALKKLFVDDWTPSVEYLLKETVVALLDFPGATILQINDFLRDESFRREVLAHCQTDGTREFWLNSFGDWSISNGAEPVTSILSRIGDFEADPLIKQIFGNPESSFNIDEMLAGGKILVVNLARGIVGDAKALTIGELLLSGLVLAAAKRSLQAIRQPFYIYLDDAHAIAGENFATALNEGKLLELNFTLASESPLIFNDSLQSSILEHVDSYLSFNLDTDAATKLEHQYQPKLTAKELSAQAARNFAASIIVDNRKTAAFTAKSLNLPSMPETNRSGVIAASRSQYAYVKRLEAPKKPKLLKSVLKVASKGAAKDHVGKLAVKDQQPGSSKNK